jgi:hypothetical protein
VPLEGVFCLFCCALARHSMDGIGTVQLYDDLTRPFLHDSRGFIGNFICFLGLLRLGFILRRNLRKGKLSNSYICYLRYL